MSSNSGARPDIDLGFTICLGMSCAEAIEWAGREGFDFVELLFDGPYARERVADQYDSLRSTLADADIGLVVHLPFTVDLGSPFTPVREGVVTELTAGMELASDLGATKIVFHPSSDAWELGWTETECQQFIHTGLDDLVPTAHEYGLEPCPENIVSGYYDVTTFPELLEHYPTASMTFDTSHALLAGMDEADMATFCCTYADRIEHFHLVDTRRDDEHLPVGMGRIDFTAVFAGLADAGWSGTATLEIGTEDFDTIALGKRHVEDLMTVSRTDEDVV